PLGKIARKTIGYQLKARRRPIKSPAELRSYVLNVKLGSSPSKLIKKQTRKSFKKGKRAKARNRKRKR
ncbi:MAG: hypothetical protein QXZ68_07880, partial [Candidatus Bathyarchaeia archaeon]